MLIFGYDLGVTSIGFAVIEQSENATKILLLGSRIIPLTTDDETEFTRGQAISKNRARTQTRSARRNLDRYQIRRQLLTLFLKSNGMMPTEEIFNLSRLELWQLRANAVESKISLQELGRVLYHLNQKRGYKSTRAEEAGDKSTTDYIKEVRSRSEELRQSGLTIGQYFARELAVDSHYQTIKKVYPRADYEAEFDQIIATQSKYYPDILTPERIDTLRNEIIYYQRQLKSQKGLVSICEFEGFSTTTKEGKQLFTGPKVAPKSSPIAQMTHLWERINNISINYKNGNPYLLNEQEKNSIYRHLISNDKLTLKDFFKLLGLNSRNFFVDKNTFSKGITGDTTRSAIRKIIKNTPFENLLEFDPRIIYSSREDVVDTDTGEIFPAQEIDPESINLPFYRLWHTIYSINNIDECAKALQKQFDFPEELAIALSKIDFAKNGYANKSVKAMRKMLPYLMQGMVYSRAAQAAGYNHSNSITKEENASRELLDRIPLLPKNSLRQPIVEKIINQLINITNALIEKFGRPDEIHVELTRELKQTAEQRNRAFANNNSREKENKTYIDELKKFGLPSTRRNIIKYRLFKESEAGLNCTCLYCGNNFGITAALRGEEVDVDHIIPQALRFDDSQSNKILVHRKCNEDKGMRTAFDFLHDKSSQEHDQYIERVAYLYNQGKITKPKFDRLMMSRKDIPEDFIERQLRQSQYIARKSAEILKQVCREVIHTGGGVTEFLRRTWGWDDVLHNLQFEKYKALGQTEIVEWKSAKGTHSREQIKDWSKRRDHRHHAIDALVIACTRRYFIQLINTLSAEETQNVLYDKTKELINKERGEKRSKLDTYFLDNKPFSTDEVEKAADRILISYKQGKRVASLSKRVTKKGGKRQVAQSGVVTPRGPLSEESVYGQIKTIERNVPIAKLFDTPDEILKPRIRKLIEERLEQFDGNGAKAKNSIKKEPIYLDAKKELVLTHGSCLRKEIVIRKPIDPSLNVEKVVDDKIRQLLILRLAEFDNNPKKAFVDLDNNPIYLNKEKGIKVSSVRIKTGLSAVEPIRRNSEGVSDAFVKPGNNHHVAIYTDTSGNLSEHVCTFWHAVERYRYLREVVIDDSTRVWDHVNSISTELSESFTSKLPPLGLKLVLSMQQNEMFILGLSPDQINDAFATNDYPLISKHLYRVQKLATMNYVFRHHLETTIDDSGVSMAAKRYYSVRSIGSLISLNPTKIRISNLGEIDS